MCKYLYPVHPFYEHHHKYTSFQQLNYTMILSEALNLRPGRLRGNITPGRLIKSNNITIIWRVASSR